MASFLMIKTRIKAGYDGTDFKVSGNAIRFDSLKHARVKAKKAYYLICLDDEDGISVATAMLPPEYVEHLIPNITQPNVSVGLNVFKVLNVGAWTAILEGTFNPGEKVLADLAKFRADKWDEYVFSFSAPDTPEETCGEETCTGDCDTCDCHDEDVGPETTPDDYPDEPETEPQE